MIREARTKVRELVELYLLSKLASLVNTKTAGLYRDEGLAVLQ